MKLYTINTEPLRDLDIFETRIKELPESRAKKARSYRLAKDRALSLGAGLLLNQALRESGINPVTVEFDTSECKKPRLIEHPDFHFNIAHSEAFAILGVGDTPLGVDIEKISPVPLDIARQYFFKSEYAYLMALPEAQRTLGFYRLWTLKESFMKAVGLGFQLPLNHFEITLTVPIQIKQQVDRHDYTFTEYQALPDYCISSCDQL